MSKYLSKIGIISFLLISISCSKNEETITPTPIPESVTPTEEIGYYSLLQNVVLANSTIHEYNWDPALSMEIGYAFTPKVNGTITSIEVKLPFIHGVTEVHIWDAESKTILRTELVNMALAHTIIKKNILGINLIANKKYAISVETNYWYRYQKADPLKINFPYSAGNITFNHAATNGHDSFPEKNLSETYFEGDVAFTFLKN